MNQTTHYALNQWAGGDRLLCADFNSDNSKIDAALKAVSDAANAEKPGLVKIREIITQSAVSQIELDVSDIDWKKYLQVDIFIEPPAAGFIEPIEVYLNRISAAETYHSCNSVNLNGIANSFASISLSNSRDYPRGRGRVTLFCGSDGISGEHASYFQKPLSAAIFVPPGKNLTFANLATVNFSCSYVSMGVGCKFTIYGVRA